MYFILTRDIPFLLTYNKPLTYFFPFFIINIDATFILQETIKLQFKRKGSWIMLKRHYFNLLNFKFGYGHPLFLLPQLYFFSRYKKHLFYHHINFVSIKQPSTFFKKLISIKPLNCYTQRGIRFNSFFLIKRTGKESQYSHLKSKIF